MAFETNGLSAVQSVQTILNFWFYLGLYRKDHVSKSKYWTYSLILHIPLTYMSVISLFLSSFNCSDLDELTKSLHTNINLLIYSVKVAVLMVYCRKIHFIIDYMKMYQYDLNDLAEMLIVAKAVKISKRIFRYTCIVYVFTVIWYAVNTLVNTNELIFNQMSQYDWDKSSSLFWFTFCCQFSCVLVQVIINSTIDSFLPSILCMLGGFCDVLGYRFMKIDHLIANGNEEKKEFFKETAIKYNQIYRIAKMIEKLYSIIILCQFSVSLITLCTTLFQISSPQNIINYLAMCLYMLSLLIEIAIPCYFGDEMYTKSGNLLNSLYACNWMSLKPKMKKNVLILMQFFNRPLQIRAGSLVTLKIETVQSIIQNAYSFYAVLRGISMAK